MAGLLGAEESRGRDQASGGGPAEEPGLYLEALGQKSILMAHEQCKHESPQHGLLEAAFKARPPPSETYCQHLT